MSDENPHRRIARIVAFTSYIVAGLVLVGSIPFVLAAATADLTTIPLKNVTNGSMVLIVGGMFAIVVLMIVLSGWRVQRLFGQHRRQEKLAAKAAVNGLRLGSLGCGLWALLSAAAVLITGKFLATDTPAGFQEVFVGSSMFIIAIILMTSISCFISKYFASLNSEERKQAYHAYLASVESRLPTIADPETRLYVQEQTVEVLPKLDAALKTALLEGLSKLRLLKGNTRIELNNKDFRQIDLTVTSLPHADLREINLEESKLRGAILFKVNLAKANLKKTDLSRARMQGANLRQADLTEAVLQEARLRGANLIQTNLKRANLSNANLSNANLEGANLQAANLREANLSGAILKETNLRGADLTHTIITPDQLEQAIR